MPEQANTEFIFFVVLSHLSVEMSYFSKIKKIFGVNNVCNVEISS